MIRSLIESVLASRSKRPARARRRDASTTVPISRRAMRDLERRLEEEGERADHPRSPSTGTVGWPA